MPGVGPAHRRLSAPALSNWEIVDFPNQNIWITLNGSVRGQDVYVIHSHARPVHRNIMEMLIAIDCLKRDSAGRITVITPTWPIRKATRRPSRVCPLPPACWPT